MMPVRSYGLRRSGIARAVRLGTHRVLVLGDSVTNANNQSGTWSQNRQSSLMWAMWRRWRPVNGLECLLAQGGAGIYPATQRVYPSGSGFLGVSKNNSPTVSANRTTSVGSRTKFALSDFYNIDCFNGGTPYTAGTNLWQDQYNLDDNNYRLHTPRNRHPAVSESFNARLLYLQHPEGLLQVQVGIGRNGTVSQTSAAFDMAGAQSIQLSPAIGTAVAPSAGQYGFTRLIRTATPDATNRQAAILGTLLTFGDRSQGQGLGLMALGTGSSTHAHWMSSEVTDLSPQAGTGVFVSDGTLTRYIELLQPDIIIHAYGYNDAADSSTWTTNRTDIVDRVELCCQAAGRSGVLHWLWTPYACTSIAYATCTGMANRDTAIAAEGTANVPSSRMASTALHTLVGQLPQLPVADIRGRATPNGDQVHPTQDAADAIADGVWREIVKQVG